MEAPDYDQYLYQRRREKAQSVPLAIRGWSGQAIFHALAGFPQSGNIEEFAVEATFKEVGYHTVQFSFQIPDVRDNVGAPVYIIKGQAEIRWTVAGNSCRRLVDVSNGTAISGLGETVYVRLLNTAISLNEFAPNAPFTAAVLITNGTRPTIGDGQPPMLFGVEQTIPAGGGTFDFLVPPECGINSVFLAATSPDATPLAGNEVTYVMNNGAFGQAGDASTFNRWIPLAPGSAFVTVTNNDAAQDVNIMPIWGVEG